MSSWDQQNYHKLYYLWICLAQRARKTCQFDHIDALLVRLFMFSFEPAYQLR